MRSAARVFIVLLIPLLVISCWKNEEKTFRHDTTEGPNLSLLLVTLDTTRRDFVSPYGADPKITPNLSRLAKEGSLFLDAYSQTNVTNPSHLSIMTGLRAADHGVFNNVLPIPEGLDTLPQAFRRVGYETAAFPSATHVGENFRWTGFEHLEPAEGELNATTVTNRVIGWMKKRSSNRPFFAWVHYWDPHALYNPPEEIAKLFYDGDPEQGDALLTEHRYFQTNKKNASSIAKWLGSVRDPEYPPAMYAAEIHYADREFGRLLRQLDQMGLDETTVVLVIADHGESLGEHGIAYDHPGIFEPQIRIPFLARIPGFPAGLRIDSLVGQLDLAPTVAEIFDLSLEHQMSGRSLVSLIKGEETASTEPALGTQIYEHAHNLQVAARKGRWKLLWSKSKLAYLPPAPLLFDLQSDPKEQHDLTAAQPLIFKELKKDLKWWIDRGWVRQPATLNIAEDELERLRALGYLQQ